MLRTLRRTQRSCRDWQQGGFSSCAMEHSKDQWRLPETTCRKTFWFCLSLVHSHRPEAVMGLDRRCVSAAAFHVVLQHKLQGWRDGHAATTPGDAVRCGIPPRPCWRGKAWQGCSSAAKGCPFTFATARHAAQPTPKPP